MSKEEPARRYALHIPTIGKRPRTSYITYVHRLLGDNEGAMQEQQIVVLAADRRVWKIWQYSDIHKEYEKKNSSLKKKKKKT